MSTKLRTLLHRNDTMGMRAGLEARFPFLDEELVATAINLPARFKIRFSPTVWEKDHPFLRDKWVLRRVADRYLPKALSQRRKRGFKVSAIRRMRIDRDFFKTGYVMDEFHLARREADHLFASADRRLESKLMMLEVWGQLFMKRATIETVQANLSRHAAFE
jgi:asparagine synthase (glutamine-hydrolysing)